MVEEKNKDIAKSIAKKKERAKRLAMTEAIQKKAREARLK